MVPRSINWLIQLGVPSSGPQLVERRCDCCHQAQRGRRDHGRKPRRLPPNDEVDAYSLGALVCGGKRYGQNHAPKGLDRETLCIGPKISRNNGPHQTRLPRNPVCPGHIRMAEQTIGWSELTTNKKQHCTCLPLPYTSQLSDAFGRGRSRSSAKISRDLREHRRRSPDLLRLSNRWPSRRPYR
jgi:hypothetical protein